MPKDRIAIVFDNEKWHVRRIRVIEHDLDRDEKVYRCDKPIASDLATLAEAADAIGIGIYEFSR